MQDLVVAQCCKLKNLTLWVKDCACVVVDERVTQILRQLDVVEGVVNQILRCPETVPRHRTLFLQSFLCSLWLRIL